MTQQLLPRLVPGYTDDVPLDDPTVRQLMELGVLDETWSKPLARGRDAADGPLGGERGRVAIYEMLSITPSLRAAVEHSTSLGEMEQCLDRNCFASFVDYARFLLDQGIVAPERVIGVVPRALGWDWSRSITDTERTGPHSVAAERSETEEVNGADLDADSTPVFLDVDSSSE